MLRRRTGCTLTSVRPINPRLIISAAQPSATVEEQNVKPGTSVSPARQVFLRGRQWEAPNVREQQKQVDSGEKGLLPSNQKLCRRREGSIPPNRCASASPAAAHRKERRPCTLLCSRTSSQLDSLVRLSPVGSWPSTASIS